MTEESTNKTWKIGCLSAAAIIIAAIIGLGAPFAERLADFYFPAPATIVSPITPAPSQPINPSTSVVIPPTSELPTTPEEAALKWGGQSAWWEQLSSTGWKLRGTLTLSVESGWRADYMDPKGNIKSCSEKIDPGVYGPVVINAVEATLWYVPGETKCPSWTIWSQNNP